MITSSSFNLEATLLTTTKLVHYLPLEPPPPPLHGIKCCTIFSPSPLVNKLTHSSRIYASIVNGNGNGDNGKNRKEDEDEQRKVHCEVEVVSWRERRIKAEMLVNADVDSVWNALTDYERLADFVPNLACR